MKKPLVLLLAFIAISSFAYAQKTQPVDPENCHHVHPKKDQWVIQGYTVRLAPGFNFTYLFEILDKDKLVHEPIHNRSFLAISPRTLLLQSIKTICL